MKGLIFFALALCSCSNFFYDDCVVLSVKQEHGIETIKDAQRWVVDNLQYQKDKIFFDEWKDPERTIRDGYGDCEDFGALICALVPDIDITYAAVTLDNKEKHLMLIHDGIMYNTVQFFSAPIEDYFPKYEVIVR